MGVRSAVWSLHSDSEKLGLLCCLNLQCTPLNIKWPGKSVGLTAVLPDYKMARKISRFDCSVAMNVGLQ